MISTAKQGISLAASLLGDANRYGGKRKREKERLRLRNKYSHKEQDQPGYLAVSTKAAP